MVVVSCWGSSLPMAYRRGGQWHHDADDLPVLACCPGPFLGGSASPTAGIINQLGCEHSRPNFIPVELSESLFIYCYTRLLTHNAQASSSADSTRRGPERLR